MTTLSRIENDQIAKLTKRILSKWRNEETLTPLTEESKKALYDLKLQNFDSIEELEAWVDRDCDDMKLTRKVKTIIYDQL